MLSLWMYQAEEDHQTLQTEKAETLNCITTSVVHCALSAHHPELNFPHPQTLYFFFNRGWYLKGRVGGSPKMAEE